MRFAEKCVLSNEKINKCTKCRGFRVNVWNIIVKWHVVTVINGGIICIIFRFPQKAR